MIYFIGGAPRIGKSTIAGMIGKDHSISVVSTDSLGSVLESCLSPEAEPDLFAISRFCERSEEEKLSLLLDNPEEFVQFVVRESLVVWKAVEAFSRREENEGRSLLVEGVAILPQSVHQIQEFDVRAVFLGNQSCNHSTNMKTSARESDYDWMRGSSDAYIEAFAGFVTQMSHHIEQEADRFGLDYVEMDGRSLEESKQLAIRLLGFGHK